MSTKKIEARLLKATEALLQESAGKRMRSNLTTTELVLVKVFAAEISRLTANLNSEISRIQALAVHAQSMAVRASGGLLNEE